LLATLGRVARNFLGVVFFPLTSRGRRATSAVRLSTARFRAVLVEANWVKFALTAWTGNRRCGFRIGHFGALSRRPFGVGLVGPPKAALFKRRTVRYLCDDRVRGERDSCSDQVLLVPVVVVLTWTCRGCQRLLVSSPLPVVGENRAETVRPPSGYLPPRRTFFTSSGPQT